jgi:hypothetical protein
MAITKRDELVLAHGLRAEHARNEEPTNHFLAGEITQEYLSKVRIVTLPVMMASADDTTPTTDAACNTVNCPDTVTLVGCGELPDDGGTSTDTDTGTTTGTGGTTGTGTTGGTGTGPGGM